MAGTSDGNHPYSKVSVAVDVTDNVVNKDVDEDEDEDTNSQEALSRHTTRTVTQQVVVSKELTAAQGSGEVTGQVTEELYASNDPAASCAAGGVINSMLVAHALNATSDIVEPLFAPPKAKASQATGVITEELPESPSPKDAKQVKLAGKATEEVPVSQDLPASKDAKQVKIAGEVTGEAPASQESTPPQTINSDNPYEKTSASDIGPSRPQGARSITKSIISAVLDGAAFRDSLSSFNETKPLGKNSGEFKRPSQATSQHKRSGQATPQPKYSGQAIPQSKPRSQTAADPPRAPMVGYEWVWFPAGYWAEREFVEEPRTIFRVPKWAQRTLRGSASTCYSTPVAPAPRSLTASEVWLKHPSDQLEDMRLMGELDDHSPPRTRTNIPSEMSSLGKAASATKDIFRKLRQISHSKKASESKSSSKKGKERETPRPTSPPVDLERQTTNTLKRTSSYFFQFLTMKRQRERAMHPLTPDEKSLRLRRKRPGLAPWHQNSSSDTIKSTTSSIKGLLFGKTPVPTPQPGAELTGAKPDEYFGVELPGSRGPRTADYGFPRTQKSQELNIPPTLRENFKEYGPQPDPGPSIPYDGESGPSATSSTSNNSKAPLLAPDPDKQFHGKDYSEVVYRDIPAPSEREDFVRELPEHLPNSPLCPMNRKHKSRGRGFCPYHSPGPEQRR